MPILRDHSMGAASRSIVQRHRTYVVMAYQHGTGARRCCNGLNRPFAGPERAARRSIAARMRSRTPTMIEYLSPREVGELTALQEAGEAWPRVLLEIFSEAARLRLGWNERKGESALAGIA